MSKKELEYQKIGDFYLPKVSFPAEDEKIENIGKYGLLRLQYLKEHKRGYYTFLMINGSVAKMVFADPIFSLSQASKTLLIFISLHLSKICFNISVA